MEGKAKFSCRFHRFVSTARILRGNFSKTGKRRVRLHRDVECRKTRRNTKEAATWGQDEGVTEDVRLPVRPTCSPFNARAPNQVPSPTSLTSQPTIKVRACARVLANFFHPTRRDLCTGAERRLQACGTRGLETREHFFSVPG